MRSFAPRTAMIFAAGRGERMRPLSDSLPKPALPLPDGPVISSPLELVARTGIRRVVVNAWHLADRLQEALDRIEQSGLDLRVSREARLMGTAGGLAAARDAGLLEGDGPVLVLNGDGVLDVTLDPALERHHRDGDLVTLALLPHPGPERWSRVLIADGRVQRILPPGRPEPGETPFVYPGAMVVAREALEQLPSVPGEVPELLWTPARRAQRLGAAVTTGRWREVGTPADYLDAVLDRLGGGTVVDPTARVHASAQLERTYVGRHAQVGPGAALRDSIVAEGAAVGAQARVARSVLLGPVRIAPREQVQGELRALPR
jgi:mannose-1-phosphate guanylyltransferase